MLIKLQQRSLIGAFVIRFLESMKTFYIASFPRKQYLLYISLAGEMQHTNADSSLDTIVLFI